MAMNLRKIRMLTASLNETPVDDLLDADDRADKLFGFQQHTGAEVYSAYKLHVQRQITRGLGNPEPATP